MHLGKGARGKHPAPTPPPVVWHPCTPNSMKRCSGCAPWVKMRNTLDPSTFFPRCLPRAPFSEFKIRIIWGGLEEQRPEHLLKGARGKRIAYPEHLLLRFWKGARVEHLAKRCSGQASWEKGARGMHLGEICKSSKGARGSAIGKKVLGVCVLGVETQYAYPEHLFISGSGGAIAATRAPFPNSTTPGTFFSNRYDPGTFCQCALPEHLCF